ncbi:MAG: AraC-like DNA-binding protein [Candidatus Azotimanducaceae bacterium]|jgi:AraC-like DNA-binding protein
MTQIRKKHILLRNNPSTIISKNLVDFFILKPVENSNYGVLSFVSSPNSNLSTYEFASPAFIRLSPPQGWVCISLKSYSQNGISPLNIPSERTTTVRVSSYEHPFWAVDQAGGFYYNIVIKASLLAKHALGMVDTSVLKSSGTWSICSTTKKRLFEKLNHIESSSRYSAELDLRIAHLILAICETIGDSPLPSVLSSRDNLAHKAVETILANQTITTEELTEELLVGKQKLDMIFKSAIGVSANQFLKAYQLNLIKDEMTVGSKNPKEYANIYGFRSPKTLSKAYTELFGVMLS